MGWGSVPKSAVFPGGGGGFRSKARQNQARCLPSKRSKRSIQFSADRNTFFSEEFAKHDRTVKPVVCPRPRASQTRFSHDSTNFNVEDETNHDRTERPVVCRDANHEQSMSNEVDIDFTVPGLPHFVVKEAENYRVRELVKKIENHRHRRSLQRDLQQNKAHNPFSTTATKMIEMKKSVSKWTILRTRISLIT